VISEFSSKSVDEKTVFTDPAARRISPSIPATSSSERRKITREPISGNPRQIFNDIE
jgi:hypothetical protein